MHYRNIEQIILTIDLSYERILIIFALSNCRVDYICSNLSFMHYRNIEQIILTGHLCIIERSTE